MQKVRISTIRIRIVPNPLLQPLLLLVLFGPFACGVCRLRLLQASQKLSIVFGYFSYFANPRSSVQGIVSIEAFRVGVWNFKSARLGLLLLRFGINLQHFAKQDPILVLDLTHSF